MRVKPVPDERPRHMLEAVWIQYRSAALTSRRMKDNAEQARRRALWLGLLGAALGALA